MREWLDALKHVWHQEEDAKLKRIAHRYDLRRHMDGDVIQKTGEIIPRESA
jgi:phosphoribosyl-dephospho-CoA transferase